MHGNRPQRLSWSRVAVTLLAGLSISVRLCAQEQADENRRHEPVFITFEAPDSIRTTPTSINTEGTITGFYTDASSVYHGFLRARDGSIITIDAPYAGTGVNQGTSPASINPESEVVGQYTDANGALHGFLRDRNGAFTKIDYPGSTGTTPNCINPEGTVIGEYSDASNMTHGFLRDRNGAFTPFDPAGSITTYPYSINAKGTIAGYYSDAKYVWRGFLRAPDGNITVFDVSNSIGVFAVGINPEGEVTGYYSDANNVSHGFRRAPDGDITVFDAPGAGTGAGQGTFAVGINPEGAITGYYQAPGTAFVVYGFLLDADGHFIDFDAPPAWTQNLPTGINAAGEIIGVYSTGNALQAYLRIRPCKHERDGDRDKTGGQNECQ